jgi:2'-5' RNA ligase
MHRLFVAIRPPDPVRDFLTGLMGGVAGARWLDDDQLHLTLRFIGEVDRHVADDVHAALGSIHQRPFELAIAGVGMFDRRGIPHALWAGVKPPEPVHALHGKVDQALVRTGLAPERRAYHPHITLARFGRGVVNLHDFLAANGGAAGEPFTVSSFGLYESVLTPDGAVYSQVERYPLT